MHFDVNCLQRPWSTPENVFKTTVVLESSRKKYFIGISPDETRVIVLLQNMYIKPGQHIAARHRRKRRICHDDHVANKLEALKRVAHHCHRKLHKEKETYKIVRIKVDETLDELQLLHLLDMKPCQVPFTIDRIGPTTVDFMHHLDDLEVE